MRRWARWVRDDDDGRYNVLLPQCFRLIEAQAQEIGRIQGQLAGLSAQLEDKASVALLDSRLTAVHDQIAAEQRQISVHQA